MRNILVILSVFFSLVGVTNISLARVLYVYQANDANLSGSFVFISDNFLTGYNQVSTISCSYNNNICDSATIYGNAGLVGAAVQSNNPSKVFFGTNFYANLDIPGTYINSSTGGLDLLTIKELNDSDAAYIYTANDGNLTGTFVVVNSGFLSGYNQTSTVSCSYDANTCDSAVIYGAGDSTAAAVESNNSSFAYFGTNFLANSSTPGVYTNVLTGGLDLLTIVAPIPEPSSWVLLIGAFGIASALISRRQNKI